MFRGFGTQNVQALVNGLIWGPDGWIYGASGGNGGEIRNLAQPDKKPVSVRGRDFRFRPDGSAFEAISGGGQFGHTFDDWGRRFTCSNSNHIRQIVLESRDLRAEPRACRIFGPRRHRRRGACRSGFSDQRPGTLAGRENSPTRGRSCHAGETSAHRAVRGGVLHVRHRRHDLSRRRLSRRISRQRVHRRRRRNLVHRKILRLKGAIHEAVRADRNVEFLASTDNWFRPVNFANTPNGTLLVLDMYRETIEHPISIPEPIKKHLDLTSGRDKGRIYEVMPDGFKRRAKPALSRATTAALVDLLADPDAWWRETAQRLLIERRDPAAIPLLKKTRDRPSPLGIAHKLWTLDILNGLSADDLMIGLADPAPNIREVSARLTEGRTAGNPKLVDQLIALAGDGSPMVLFQTAFSLGACDDERVPAALARIASREFRDPWTSAAVLSSLAGRLPAFLKALDARPEFGRDEASLAFLEEVAALAGAEHRPEALETLLAKLADPMTDLAGRQAVALGLDRGLRRSGESLRKLLKGKIAVAVAPLFPKSLMEAESPNLAPNRRARAVRALGLEPIEDAIPALSSLLDFRRPVEVQLAALQALGDLSDRRVGPDVAARWKTLSPQVRREAAEVLFARTDRLLALLDAIEAGAIAANELDTTRALQLSSHRDPAIRDRAKRLLKGVTRADREQVVKAMRPALSLIGDRSKGLTVFKKSCAMCHQAEGQGESVGPDLATITGRSAEDLLIHILDPNREVPPAYLVYIVATTDGREFSGIIITETANGVTLKRGDGVSDAIPRDRIEAISSTAVSLMPEGLEQGLTTQDFADLIAFLRTLKPTTVVPK